MNKQEVAQKVREIIADKTGCELKDLTSDASLKENLGLDSLDLVEIVMGIESEFSVTIPDDKAEKVVTVQDCIDLVEVNE